MSLKIYFKINLNEKIKNEHFFEKVLTKNKCSFIIISQSKQIFFLIDIGGNYNENSK